MKINLLIWLVVFLNLLFIIPVDSENLNYIPDKIYDNQVQVASIQVASSSSNVGVSNNFLEISVERSDLSDLGRFTLGCTGGDPSNPNDDNQILLYGHPSPGTSFTTVRIDENDFIYGSEVGSFTEVPTDYGTYTKGVWECNDIQVTQVCGLVSNPSTGRPDLMQVKYQLTNEDPDNSHNVGLRILLDTMLGPNDGAPFYVPSVGALNTEREFLKSNDEIPDFWQSFDNLENPSVVAQGTLDGSGATEPDRIIFASWPDFVSTMWDYTITHGKIYGSLTYPDSSVGLYWNEVSLDPNETKEYITYYGLSDLSQSVGDIDLSVTSPIQLEVIDGQYSPNPFTINAYVDHDLTNAIDVELNIDLPEGLELILGSYETQTITVDSEGGSVAWFVRASEQAESQLLTYSVTASAEGIDDQSVSRGVTVPGISLEYDTGFRPDPHGYSFINTGRDGFSWDQFSDLYGEDEVEITGQRLPRAETFFEHLYTHIGNGGRCFGMSASSLYLYQNALNGSETGGGWLDVLPQWNIFPGFINTNQDWIEYYQPRQADEACQNERNTYDNAEVVYNEMKQRMASGNWEDDPMVLDIWWHEYEHLIIRRNYGHTVTPTRIVEAANHLTASVFIYDNSKSTTTERELVFDLSTWEVRDASQNSPWNQGNDFDSVSAVSLSAIQQEPQMRNYEFVTSPTGHLLYTDSSGNQLGYNDDLFEDDIQEAYKVKITSSESNFSETYYTGDLDLKRQIVGEKDGITSVSVMRSNALITIDLSTTENSTDSLYIPPDDSSANFTSGNGTDFVRLLIDQETDNYARLVTIETKNFEPGENFDVSFIDDLTGIKIVNSGKERDFNLCFEQIGINPGKYICPTSLKIGEHSSEEIVLKDWDNIKQSLIQIQEDIGNDGSIDNVRTVSINPSIDIEKFTNGKDADSVTSGISIGDTIEWKYVITNSGNVLLENISLIDDKEGIIPCPKDSLDPGESMECLCEGTAEYGYYKNIAYVTGEINGIIVNDTDFGDYYGFEGGSGDWEPPAVPTASPLVTAGILGLFIVLFLRKDSK